MPPAGQRPESPLIITRMENILVIRLKAIGDVIFTLPAVAALRDRFPSAKITFLTSRENAPLLRGFRDVNEVIVMDRAALRSGNPLRMGRELFGLLRRLRAGGFSLVVDFQGFGETAWLTRLTGARERWGSVHKSVRRWAYTRGLTRDNQIPLLDWNLKLLAGCGVQPATVRNEFVLPADALAAAQKFYADRGLAPDRPTLAIQPLTSTPQKNWPLENFLAVARHWQGAGVQIVFLGGPKDAAALEPVRAANFCVATDLPLLGSAGVVKLATLTLGGDSGLVHLAVAQGCRVVTLLMHGLPGANRPFQHPDWAISATNPGCINEIPVQAVLEETGRVLKRRL